MDVFIYILVTFVINVMIYDFLIQLYEFVTSMFITVDIEVLFN